MEELVLELKKQIIEVLNLEEMTPEDIDTDSPLFGEGLGLDSIEDWQTLQKERQSLRA